MMVKRTTKDVDEKDDNLEDYDVENAEVDEDDDSTPDMKDIGTYAENVEKVFDSREAAKVDVVERSVSNLGENAEDAQEAATKSTLKEKFEPQEAAIVDVVEKSEARNQCAVCSLFGIMDKIPNMGDTDEVVVVKKKNGVKYSASIGV